MATSRNGFKTKDNTIHLFFPLRTIPAKQPCEKGMVVRFHHIAKRYGLKPYTEIRQLT